MLADETNPFGHTPHKALVARVGSVSLGHPLQQTQIQVHLDRESADAQVVEIGPQVRDLRHVALERVLDEDLRDYTVGGHDIQDIQVLDHRRGQRVPAVPGLVVLVARDLGMRRRVRNNSFHAEIIGVLGKVSAAVGNLGVGLALDQLPVGQVQLTLERGSFRVVPVRPPVLFGHSSLVLSFY